VLLLARDGYSIRWPPHKRGAHRIRRDVGALRPDTRLRGYERKV